MNLEGFNQLALAFALIAESMLSPKKEVPLSPFRRRLLIAAAAGLILLSYVLGIGWILLLPILVLFEVLMAGAAARFGGSALFIRWAKSHWQVLMIFLRSGWIDSGESETILLAESDAPGLYRSTRMLCDAAGIEFPDEIHLALNLNASVRLPGFRKGKGRSVLSNPDLTVARLLNALNDLATRQEHLDSREHRRKARRIFAKGRLQPLQILASAFIGFGCICIGLGAFTFIVDLARASTRNDGLQRSTVVGRFHVESGGLPSALGYLGPTVIGLVFGVPGIILYRSGGNRADFEIPIPDHSTIIVADKRPPLSPNKKKNYLPKSKHWLRRD